MDAAAVAGLLDKLRAGGCAKVRATFEGAEIDSIDVEFSPGPLPVTPFRDKDGRPLDLDADLPTLARDPDDARAPVVESSDAALERANFGKKKAA
jgi:hypothetical protein